MTAAGWVALAITVFGAICYAAAAILQAVAARRSASTVKTLGHPLYLLGIGCDALAWVGSMIALRELAVYVVEAILAGSLGLTVLAARFILKSRLRKRDVVAVVASLSALAVLAMSAGAQHNVVVTTELRLGFCGAAVAVVLLGRGAVKIGSPGAVAALGGLCLGGAALTGRALPSAPMDILTDPMTAALLTFAVTGMLMYAHALQIGQVGPVTAVHWTAEVIAPSAVALLFLGDTVRTGWGPAAAIAGLVTVGAAVLLATAPANNATHQPEALPVTTGPSAMPLRVRRNAERVIWWGPPPVWTPRPRTAAALDPAPVHQLTWAPPQVQPPWAAPLRPDADQDEIPVPVKVRRSTPEEPLPAEQPRAQSSPWPDL